ncbi:prepilin peptidase [Microbacterium sp. ARD32]|uniref:prepilin peptidase n=1 Tax=Microbacterium sp. ARD32 TaxID=2962577 RepID=UPI002880D33C|nr:prepilin peptidase [Microbacterium sp. ARD32]MDT0158032.1 prepilin peptidase [Microbacterium sp. ARD32]
MTPTTTFVAVWAGVFGLAIGSFLNVVAYRVPAGIPLTRESRCPGCDAPIAWWRNVPVIGWLTLRGRCADCRMPISIRYPLVELGTGMLFAGVAVGVAATNDLGTVRFWGVLAVLELFAALSVVLTLIDLDVKRLPNAIVLPGWAAVAVLIVATTALGVWGGASTDSATQSATQEAGEWWGLVRALIGGTALYLLYALVRWISPRGMGGGDVKLAGLVGTVLGWFGWGALAVGAFAAFALGGAFGIALIAIGRAKRGSGIPFGPWMLAGAWVGLLVGEPIGRWYVGLLG